MIKFKSISDHVGIKDHLDEAKDIVDLGFKKAVELVLEQRPDISAEQIRDMINEKKRKVGAGYLTDRGALFLVGADLGISFENVPKLSSGIKDLPASNEVTITRKGFYYAIKVSGEAAENFDMASYVDASRLSLDVLKYLARERFDNPNREFNINEINVRTYGGATVEQVLDILEENGFIELYDKRIFKITPKGIHKVLDIVLSSERQ
jgi:hypothetical protein